MRIYIAFAFALSLCLGAGSAKADWFSFDFQSIVDMLTQTGSGDLSASQSASISQTP
jgi:hypothetical protein